MLYIIPNVAKIVLLGVLSSRVGADWETESSLGKYCQLHLIDYFILPKRDIQVGHIVRSMRGADCWTDNALVRAKINIVLKPATRQRDH